MWLSDFEIVLPDRVLPHASLRIEDGTIAEIVEGPVAEAAFSGAGMTLLPGFVDIHGDMVEREIEPRPNVRMPLELGIFELDKKLAASGITTAFAALSFSPSSTYGHLRSEDQTRQVIEAIVALRGELLVDHRIHARFEVTFPKAASVVEDLLRGGALDMISLMDHTPGQGQYRDIERYVATMAQTRRISQDEAAEQVRQRLATRAALQGSAGILHSLSELARERGIVVASHDDDTAEKIVLMHGLGARISEFPVTEEAAREARRHGLWTAMGAPNALRGQSYSGNLSAREAHAAGILDILASDYHPSAMLPAVFALAGENGDLAAAAALVSANPAKAVGLEDRGELRVGLVADIVVAQRGRLPRVRATFRGGRMVYFDGMLAARQAA